MDALNDYSDHDASSEDCEAPSVTVALAPQVPLTDQLHVTGTPQPLIQHASNTAWNPAGHAQHFDIGSSTFARQEYSFGRHGVFNDPETYELRKATTVYAAHPESRVHAKRAKVSAPTSASGTTPALESTASQTMKPPTSKRPRKERNNVPSIVVPTSELHVRADSDYLGRTWLHPPSNARTFEELEEYTAYIPKRCTTEFDDAHPGGVSTVRFFPQYGHLLLSGGLDGVAK
eukprot:IDg14710t1